MNEIEKKIEELTRAIEGYRQAIEDAEGALDAAEKELDAAYAELPETDRTGECYSEPVTKISSLRLFSFIRGSGQ